MMKSHRDHDGEILNVFNLSVSFVHNLFSGDGSNSQIERLFLSRVPPNRWDHHNHHNFDHLHHDNSDYPHQYHLRRVYLIFVNFGTPHDLVLETVKAP